MTEKQIQNKIFLNLQDRNRQNEKTIFFDITPNVWIFDWESDILFKNSEDFIFEMEIKTSLQDYQNDFINKKKKHDKLANAKEDSFVPAYFYFVVPVGIVDIETFPIYAGLYEYQIFEGELIMNLTKQAPRLTEKKANKTDTIKMLRSTSFKYWRGRTGQQTRK